MTTDLDIHAASHDELSAAHRNVFDIWSKGLPLEEHIQHRLTSPTHRRAEWYVGTLDGRVVVSLGCYRVRFRLAGRELPGMAIGSVYTVADARGRGYAPRLIAWVEDQKRAQGTALSILYSDIQPDYYARQGYVLCPSLEGWRILDNDNTGAPPALPHIEPPVRYRLVPFAVAEHLATVKQLYAAYHGATPLSIARDDDYWTMVLEKFADDRFYALADQNGAWQGYVRVGRKDDAWRITDYALADDSQALAEAMYAAFLWTARAEGGRRAGGWLPDSAAARKYFTLTPRRTEITMIKPLVDGCTLSDAAIAASSRFCELDHV